MAPNVVHTVTYRRLLTPEMVLKGQKAEIYQTSFAVLSRFPQHSGAPSSSIPTVTFSVEGMPGPLIKDLIHDDPKKRLVVDLPKDCPFRDLGWKVTNVVVDVSQLCVHSRVDVLT